MQEPHKLDTKIDIHPPPQQRQPQPEPASSATKSQSSPPTSKPHKSSFGKTTKIRKARDTWVISVFVIVHFIVFLATMYINDCPTNSLGDCSALPIGKFSFQPLPENPLLGPSLSTLDKMGALRRTLLAKHQIWRLLSSSWLHAGVIHLIIGLVSTFLTGIYLEQEFGTFSVGIIYVLSSFVGTMVAALFIRDSPAVTSSSALFGLLGAKLTALLGDWDLYTHKASTLITICFICLCNFLLGLLPFVDNYSNIGGLLSGCLLGSVLLWTPQLKHVGKDILDVHNGGANTCVNLKQKLDKPVQRSISLLLFSIIFVGCLVAVILGINLGKYCSWCALVDCIPSGKWSCANMTKSCKTMVSNSELTLTCIGNGNFRVFPFINISTARTIELCTLICS